MIFKSALILGAVYVLSVAVRLSPDARGHGTHEQLGWEPCGFLAAHGKPCPTCGMTTSFSNAVRFRIVEAARANPAGLVLAVLCMIMPFYLLHSLWTGMPATRILHGRLRLLLFPGVFVIVLVAWAFKWLTWTN